MDPLKFFRIAESLRQYRRADLKDFEPELGESPVDQLYVDALPNDAVLNSVLTSNTTFLLGRKGTGKSTVFARAQSILRKRPDLLTTYIDVKTLADILESSELPGNAPDNLGIDDGIYRSHIMRKIFLGKVLSELVTEIGSRCESMSIWDRWSGTKRTFQDLKSSLSALADRIRESSLQDHEVPILRRITTKTKQRKEEEQSTATGVGSTAGISVIGPHVSGHASRSEFGKSLDDQEVYREYSDVIVRSFPFNEIINEIQDLVAEAGLKRIVVFFDDFSELNYLDQRLFVDVVLSPLNNASNEAIKLKVAGYPGRVYYGRIDPGKVDTVSLDFSSLYEQQEIQGMESDAIDYAKRLIEKRFEVFKANVSDYFDPPNQMELFYRLLFQTTFNVPRLMGIVLHTCYLDRIAKRLPITAQSMRMAARKHYENTISRYFDRMNRFALEPFDNKLDRHNQQELLNFIIEEARAVRSAITLKRVGGQYFDGLSAPPTSHFIVTPTLSDVFRSLESNFLVSKYKDTRDKDAKSVSVYALYYGLAEANRLAWGYPEGREYRNYFVQRCFDFSAAIHEFLARKQTIRCGECDASFPLSQKPSIELYKWKCPECGEGTCSIVNLADDFIREVEELQEELRLEAVELEILDTLMTESMPLRAGEISVLIDVTYQLVGRRTSKLRDKGLVLKDRDPDGIVRNQLSPRARATYFADAE